MYVLQYTNKWREKYYFIATGVTHYSGALARTIHLIDSTTTDKSKGRRFESKEDAELILARTANSNKPDDADDDYVGWEILPTTK